MPYFYQHSEGSIIEKPANVVKAGGGPWEYFTGPFVRDWWFENDLLRPLRTPAPPEPIIATCVSCDTRHKIFIHHQ